MPIGTSPTSRASLAAASSAHAACTLAVEVERQSIIVEGTARTLTDDKARGRFNELYLAKYEFDMSGWTDPVYMVTPRVAFGYIDQPGKFEATATRWTFTA